LLLNTNTIAILLEVIEYDVGPSKELAITAIQIIYNLCFHNDEVIRLEMGNLIKKLWYNRLQEMKCRTIHVKFDQHIIDVCACLESLADDIGSSKENSIQLQKNKSQASVLMESLAETKQEDFDVMISYSWASQKLVLCIRERLRVAGLKVSLVNSVRMI
jgi:hypothetical protein